MITSNTQNDFHYEAPPKKAFDMEYNTQYRREYEFLKARGIEPSFIKRGKKYRIVVYKYTKTPELFRAVGNFYEMLRREKEYENADKALAKYGKAAHDEASAAVVDALIMHGAPLRRVSIHA